MRTRKSHEGYLMVDHRASPGLSEEDARRAGYDPAQCGEGKMFEAATMTCSHCKIAVVKNPLRTRDRASCHKCGYHYICDYCAADMLSADYDHKQFEEVIDLSLTYKERGYILDVSPRAVPLALYPVEEAPKLILPPSARTVQEPGDDVLAIETGQSAAQPPPAETPAIQGDAP